MKEKDFIKIIKETLNSDLIGDDCAYLRDLGIVVTQDSLIEDVHFSMKYSTPFELGYKSAMVNISDVVASGASPKYLTIALSLPKNIETRFVKEFYEGIKTASKDVKIAGGDITGADKICISITAIGSVENRNISSRSFAKVGQKIVVSGLHGSSSAGLKTLLTSGKNVNNKFVKAHLMPFADVEFSKEIATTVTYSYAMMDTSDGLADALGAIAEASKVCMSIDFAKIPYDKDIEQFENYKDLILYGGEDYKLVATLDEKDCQNKFVIGEVKAGHGVEINYGNYTQTLTSKDIENKIYNHFE